MVKIISDSRCDLSPELIAKYDIDILPLHILLGEDEYEDGKNITPEQIYSWSDENKTTPKTSAPALTDAIELFKPYIDEGREIVCFSISSSMSTSGNVMRIAAEELEAEDGRIWPMTGVLKGKGYKKGKNCRFGYIGVETEKDSLYLNPGEQIRGHEFHYWDCEVLEEEWVMRAKKPVGNRSWPCMRIKNQVMAGFPHLFYIHTFFRCNF